MPISKVIYGADTIIDITDTTATASDVAEGKILYTADGLRTVGTGVISGGAVEKKDVNFYDYDGTRLYSYSASDFANLSAMPSNPTHTGLTAQGWNWTLEQIKAQLTAVPGGVVNVGQMYITDDGKTRVYIHLEEGRLSPTLGLAIKGSVDIDWSDGSTHDTATGTSETVLVNTQHNYAAAGDYVITLTVTGKAVITGANANSGSGLLWKADTSTANNNRVYQNAIRRVEIGENVKLEAYVFASCSSLTSVTIPSGVTSIGGSAFYSCYSLTSVTIPSGVTSIGGGVFFGCSSLASINILSGVTSIGSSAFASCSSLTSVTIPSGVTSISGGALSGCSSLASITIPSGVTRIGGSAFYSCNGLGFIRFKGTMPPTVSNVNAWGNIPTDCIIYVPTGKLSAYKSASNYPDSNTYTYVEE